MLPGRHLAAIDDPVVLPPMPNGVDWTGDIAYLDRDGVLNVGRDDYVKTVDEVVMLEGAGDAVARLRHAGFRVVIVTNQSPVNRGMFTHEELAAMNDAVLAGLLAQNPDAFVDLVLYSQYAPWEGSPVRKPGAGMLQVGRQILDGIPLETAFNSADLTTRPAEGRSFMAGDRDADEGAGWNHGVPFYRIDAAVGIAGRIDDILSDRSGDASEIAG